MAMQDAQYGRGSSQKSRRSDCAQCTELLSAGRWESILLGALQAAWQQSPDPTPIVAGISTRTRYARRYSNVRRVRLPVVAASTSSICRAWRFGV